MEAINNHTDFPVLGPRTANSQGSWTLAGLRT